MLPLTRAALLTMTAAATVLASTACRTPRRSVRVGGDTATVKVRLANLDAADSGKGNWIYELSGERCISPLNGTLVEGEKDIVAFSSIGLKKGLECQVKVKTLSPSPTIAFAANSEPNVLYWARTVIIRTSATGGLETTAGLQKLFTIRPVEEGGAKTFSLAIPVKFPAPEVEGPITARIFCTPQLADESLYPADKPVEGVLQFTANLAYDTKYSCTHVLVSAGGQLHKYKGTIVDGAFTAIPDQVVTLKQVTLELQDNGTTSGDDSVKVEVGTTVQDCTAAGKVFDVDLGKCVDDR